MVKKIEHDHPLYLTSFNVPGVVQIGIQLVGMENYTLWSRAMQLNLLTKNKLGFIDGSIKRDDFIDDVEKKQWDTCNAMVISWIMTNVSKELRKGGRGYGNSQKQQRGSGSYCDYCDMKGHTREDCNKLKHCTYCNMQGHTKDICFQLIGYPPD
ncbi:hypothetical protein KY290_011155 [Solanum tuberosum]|uniref:Retrotransposon Copia-like N-terminal domain-containing protein n=1 Tax=Solanum tuberosum TaxID=4113 RepID=A0ABQ7VZV5_SOLTU|nr:hypothetical protein KY290_011155 [Solanum tuberosum]